MSVIKQLAADILPPRAYLELRWFDYKLNRRAAFEETQKLRHRDTTEGGSYKLFDDSRSIFAHVPKCAGISVNKALYGNLAGGHTTLDQSLIYLSRLIF